MTRVVIRSAKRVLKARPPPSFIPAKRLTEELSSNSSTPEPKLSSTSQQIPSSASIPEEVHPEKFIPRGRKLPAGPREPPKPNFATQVSQKFNAAIEQGDAHFRVGGREIYFPTAKVVLVRPNAKHTPYQAKFVVPRYFNKLDLRDYLYHVYGLRALNVTTQLLWARWQRQTPRSPRYRETQIKKMTIEMEDPFVWPEEPTPEEKHKMLNLGLHLEMEKFTKDLHRLGSDQFKEPKAFGGLVGPFPPEPQPFIPKHFKASALKAKSTAEKAAAFQSEQELVKRFLRL